MHLLLFVWLRVAQFFQPEPPLIIARETTYITEPLRPDGLPDYEKYVLELYRDGATPENNATVLVWQAMPRVPSCRGVSFTRLVSRANVSCRAM